MLLPSKRAIAEGLLERGSMFVHLDPRVRGVMVPPFLRSQPQVVLQVGLDMPIPIPDLTVDDHGVVATLSFSRTPHRCVVPWDAVFALVGDDGRGRVFLDSMPAEIRREIDREAGPSDAEEDERDSSEEIDAFSVDEPTSTGPVDDNVIPLWPRSVKGRSSAPPPRPPSPAALPSASGPGAPSGTPSRPSEPPPEKPRPRPPHPHLRRIK